LSTLSGKYALRRAPPPPSRDSAEDDGREYEEDEEELKGMRNDTSSTSRHALDASIDSCQCQCEPLELELEEPRAEPFPAVDSPEDDEEGSVIVRY
jgi:hypothetical protein